MLKAKIVRMKNRSLAGHALLNKDMRVWQELPRGLPPRIRPLRQLRFQPDRIVLVLQPQLKDLKRGVEIRELEHRRIVEVEVLRAGGVVADNAGTLGAKDFDSDTPRLAVFVREDLRGLVRKARNKIVRLAWSGK